MVCQLVQIHHPHLIIMDVMMPQCNGLMATMRIRQDNNVPILMLSAKAEGSDRVLGLEAGADDYLVKPFYQQELLALQARHQEAIKTAVTSERFKVELISNVSHDPVSYTHLTLPTT